MISISEKWIKRLDLLLNKIEYFLDNAVDFLWKMLNAFFSFVFLLISTFFKIMLSIFEAINNVYSRNNKLIRYLSLPPGALIVIGRKLIYKSKMNKIPLLIPGMHMVRAGVGGGKSLTSFVLAQYVFKKYGFPSYMTSAVEKPKLSECGKYWYVNHPVIDLDDYYQGGKKILNYNTSKFPYFHKDEKHLRHNPRLNKTKAYNDTFIPEHADELVMRHDGFYTITKYSQHQKLDVQEMETLTLMHEVNTVKDITISNWLKDGSYNYVPIKLKFISYKIITDFNGDMKRVVYKRWKMKVKYEDLLEYDTHAERNKNAHLPYDY